MRCAEFEVSPVVLGPGADPDALPDAPVDDGRIDDDVAFVPFRRIAFRYEKKRTS